MGVVVQWYDAVDELLDVESIVLSGTPGQRGTAVAVKLYNNRSGVGADPLENAFIRIQARLVGEQSWLADGLPALDQAWVEVRITGGLGWTTGSTDWTPLGPGLYLPVPTLANALGLGLELALNQPFSGQPTVLEVAFELVSSTGQPIGDGLTEATPDGVFLGLRDGRSTFLFRATNATESSPADGNIQLGAYAGVSRGVPFCLRPSADASPNAAAGKARYDLYVVDVDGTLDVLTGAEVTTPTDADKPAAGQDQIPLCYLYRADAGNVTNADIDNVWLLGACQATYSASSPVFTVGSGQARVDNWFTRDAGSRSITLTLSATNSVWLLRSGTLAKTTDGSRPAQQPRAFFLGEAVVDGTGVTSFTPQHYFVGHEVERVTFDFGFGEVVEDEWHYAYVPGRRAALVPPTAAMHLMLGEQQAGGSSGSTKLRVQVRVAGAWTDLVTAGADYPAVAYNAGNSALRAAADADLMVLPADTELRACASDLPVGSTTKAKGVVGVLELSP